MEFDYIVNGAYIPQTTIQIGERNMSEAFQVKSDPELWEKLGMDVARFSGMPPMLPQAYTNVPAMILALNSSQW